FFQAEDGIRDRNVTGVQTCALPISRPMIPRANTASRKLIRDWREDRGPAETFQNSYPRLRFAIHPGHRPAHSRIAGLFGDCFVRSEERRVGKECRSW